MKSFIEKKFKALWFFHTCVALILFDIIVTINSLVLMDDINTYSSDFYNHLVSFDIYAILLLIYLIYKAYFGYIDYNKKER